MKASQLATYIRAAYACLYVVSHEEERITTDIRKMSEEIGYGLWSWTCTEGLKFTDGKVIEKTDDPIKALNAFIAGSVKGGAFSGDPIKNKSIVIMKDIHLFMKSSNPVLIRKLKEAILVGRASNRHIIILGCQLHLPPELEKEITVIEFQLPTRSELKVVADQITKSAKTELNGDTEAVLDAGSGLTTNEFADALAYSIVESKKVDPKIIFKIKTDTIKKNGILEIVTADVDLDDIGGLEVLKEDLHSKRNIFSKEAKDYGLPTPRPLLAVGQPGTGKSLVATATKAVFGIPLLRLEAGRIFDGLVGGSEKNWRTAFATAKAISPCILWIDEVDGLFSGGESSGKTDGGTTARVIKTILQDIQFNSDGVFFVFTANDIDGLPDPLIDRCDVWNVELPNTEEREAIWKIHIAKRKRDPKKFKCEDYAAQTEGFSGRQIEQAWIKAMNIAFNDKAREPKDKDVVSVLKEFVPTSVTMKDAIERRRSRLKGCAKPASAKQNMEYKQERKIEA